MGRALGGGGTRVCAEACTESTWDYATDAELRGVMTRVLKGCRHQGHCAGRFWRREAGSKTWRYR